MSYLYITLTLIAWTTIAFAYRYTDKRAGNRLWMGVAMGFMVTAGNAVIAASKGINPLNAATSQYIIGAILGVITIFTVLTFMAAIKRGDLSVTWTLLTLSFALSSLAVMIYPGEKPTTAGIAGLLVAAFSVILLGIDMHERNRRAVSSKPQRSWAFFIAISFLSNASCMYLYSLASHFSPNKSPVHEFAFLLSFGIVFCLGSLILALLIKQTASAFEGLKGGVMTGVLMFLGTFFTVCGINHAHVPGYVFYPITTGGSTVLVFLLSVLFLKEKPGRYGWGGLAAGTIAVILLGIAA